MSSTSSAAVLLGRQLKQMQADKDLPGISCGLVDSNVFEWEVMLMMNDECKYYGGMWSQLYSDDAAATDEDSRGILPRPSVVPARIPFDAAQDEVRDFHLPPQRISERRRLHINITSPGEPDQHILDVTAS
jgi:hypothetical protein